MTGSTKPDHNSRDWTTLHDRLERVRLAFSEMDTVSPARGREIMDARARALARRSEPPHPTGTHLELLVFGLGKEIYALGTGCVREVTRFEHFAPIPAAPAFVVGVTNLRGEILTVIDLRRFFGIPPQGLTDLTRIIVLGDAHNDLAILADEVKEIVSLPLEELRDSPVPGIGMEYLRGVTSEAMIVLNGEILLKDERLFVNYLEKHRSAVESGGVAP